MKERHLNPWAWLLAALKTWPEQPTLPEPLQDATPVELAEARNRMAEYAQCATELRRLIDQELARKLDGAALRYGDSIYHQSNVGRPKIVDVEAWWAAVIEGLKNTAYPEALLGQLYPARAVRLSGLPLLAQVLGEEPIKFRRAHIDYDPPSTSISEVPIHRAPKYLQRLGEGKTTYDRKEEE